ncbi:hypothetical protein G9A89_017403 [Geosiphon pyriformis]|nr:hypothetical protein G9A89_017403 [Geosiphon pyriformis]
MFSVLPDLWAQQYVLLDYIRDDAFSDVMCLIGMSNLLLVVNSLANGKTVELSGISNKLIHKNKINKVMTDFGLSDGYRVHDSLD